MTEAGFTASVKSVTVVVAVAVAVPAVPVVVICPAAAAESWTVTVAVALGAIEPTLQLRVSGVPEGGAQAP